MIHKLSRAHFSSVAMFMCLSQIAFGSRLERYNVSVLHKAIGRPLQNSVAFLPEHCCPSPVKPVVHWHVNDPAVSEHVALESHVWLPLLHSLISAGERKTITVTPTLATSNAGHDPQCDIQHR